MDEAGWVEGSDGIRAKNGVRMSLKINSTSGNQLREQTEQVLVEMFHEQMAVASAICQTSEPGDRRAS